MRTVFLLGSICLFFLGLPPRLALAQVGIEINNGQSATNQRVVNIRIMSANVKEMQLANQPVFDSVAGWEPFRRTLTWELAEGDGKKTIYARFREREGRITPIYQASIQLTTKAPTNGRLTIAKGDNYINRPDHIEIWLSAKGASFFQLAEDQNFTGAPWVVFREKYLWDFSPTEGKKTLYARFKDEAGNVSEAVSDQVTYDGTPPEKLSLSIYGDGVVKDPVSGLKYINKHNASVNLSIRAKGAEFMRLANTSSFYGIRWRQFDTTYVEWPLENPKDGHYSVHVEFMDKSKNISVPIAERIIVDTQAPLYCGFSINRNELFALQKEVTLHLRTFDAQTMLISERPDFAGAAWEPFRAERKWTFEGAEGKRTVYVKFRDPALNESPVFQDDILLDMTPPTVGNMVINKGAANTEVPYVKVQVTGAKEALMMQVSESPDFARAGWILYSEKPFTHIFSEIPGKKSLYARFQDEAGNISKAASASIILENPPQVPTNSLRIIANGDYCNDPERKVWLELVANQVTEMRIANDSALSAVAWEPYQKRREWQLAQGNGMKKVFVQYRSDTETESRVYSDQIWLDNTPPKAVSLQVNGGKPNTLNQYVPVLAIAEEATVMQVSHHEDFVGAKTISYQGKGVLYNFGEEKGPETLYARFLDEYGNTSEVLSSQVMLEVMPFRCRMSIDNDAEVTFDPNRKVNLRIQAENVTEMLVSNHPDFAGAQWEPYQKVKEWELPEGDGFKQVYVKLRNETLWETATLTDRILLDYNPPTQAAIVLNKGIKRTNNFFTYVELKAEGAVSMQASRFQDFAGAKWRSYDTDPFLIDLHPEGGLTTIYARFKDLNGNLSETISATIQVDVHPVNCQVVINAKATYCTHPQREVILKLRASNAKEVMISNEASFAGGVWEPFAYDHPWLLSEGDGNKTVYVKFRSHTLTESPVVTDQIILDLTPPSQAHISAKTRNGFWKYEDHVAMITVGAKDAVQMQLSESATFEKARWLAYTEKPFRWALSPQVGEKTLYARFRDVAGNISEPVSATATVDGLAPNENLFVINEGEAFAQSPQVRLQFALKDAHEVRIANDPVTIKQAEFRPTSEEMEWELGTNNNSIKTVYVQYRDKNGNISAVQSSKIELDQQPPQRVSAKVVGNSYLQTPAVTLALAAQGARYVGVSETSDPEQAQWRNMTPQATWAIPDQDGASQLYVFFADEAGNQSEPIALDYTLDREAPEVSEHSVNNGGQVTNQPNVTLLLSAQSAKEMIISNDGNFALPYRWEPYQSEKKWKLATGDGIKQIFVKFRDEAGNESPVSVLSILLDTEPPVTFDFQINQGETATEETQVTLHFRMKASPLDAELPDAKELQVSNSPDFSRAEWQPFLEEVPWQIGGTLGLRKVYVRFRDEAGNISLPQVDEIMLYERGAGK